MACVAVVVMLAVVLLLPVRPLLRSVGSWRVVPLVDPARSGQPSRPPSLHVLCVSRT